MLFEYHQGTLGPLEANKLQECLKIAEDLRILRMDGESDEDYAERAIKIAQLSEEIPKLFLLDRSLDTGSIIDAVTLGLAGIISTNYKDDSKDDRPIHNNPLGGSNSIFPVWVWSGTITGLDR